MPITEQLKQYMISIMPGMNNLVEDLDLKEKWVQIAQNCRFEPQPGSVTKRDPVTYYNTNNTGSGAVTGLFRYYTSTGNIKFIKVHGTKAYVGTDATGTWTEIRANLTDGKRASFEVYKDLLLVGNGADNTWVYDGASDNVTWELGACKGVLGSGAGNLDASADYYYAVTFDDDAVVNGAVSNTVSTDGSNQKITLSNIPLGPAGTTNRKIYRTEGDGSSLKLLATIADNTTTTYADNIADGSLGAAYPSVTDDMPKGSILKVHRERLFTAGDPTNPNKIYYSNVYLPHYIQQTTNLDYMEISPEDGDEIMGIPIQLGVMVCVKKNTIRKLHISSAVSGADPATWYADDPIAFVGSPAQWSITQTPYGIVFLGWDHWYVFDGAQATPIMDEFDTREVLPSSYSDTVGFFHKGIFLAAYSDLTTAAQYHNRIMRYNFKRKALSLDSWTSTTISGANCFAATTGDDETGELYYGDSQNGYVLKAQDAEENYRLRTKTDCLGGSTSNIFIGGTENAPYIEIGATTSADTIPDNICILWDSSDEAPGTGWEEVTDMDGRFIKIDTQSVGTTTDAVGVSGDSYVAEYATSYRLYKASSNTDTEFPIGSIVIWDQTTPPTGYSFVESSSFIRIDSSLTDYPQEIIAYNEESGTAENIDNIVSVRLIKKVSEADTWDGSTKYVYALWYSDGGTSNGWSDVTSSYNGYHLKSATSGAGPTTTDGGDSSSSSDYVFNAYHTETTDSDADETSFEGDQDDGYNRDNSDYRQFYGKHNGDGTVTIELTHEHTWDDERDIDSVTVKSGIGTYGGNYKDNDFYSKTYLKVSGSWTLIKTRTITGGQGSNQWYYKDWEDTTTTGWSNVTGIKVEMYGWAYSYEGNRRQEAKLRLYDVRCEGKMKSVSMRIARKLLGKMRDYNTGIESQYTEGTWTSPSQQISAESLNLIYWNEDIDDTVNDDVIIHTRTGATQSACEAAGWSTGLTDPNGSQIASTPNVWFQYKIEFTAADTQVTNPRVYFSDGFVVRYTYERGATLAETSVNWLYDFGVRVLDTSMLDKFHKKMSTIHEGTVGSFTFTWHTEHGTDSFTIDLTQNPERWESYFQDTAIGREIRLVFQKNDLNNFKLKKLKGVYSEYPAVI
jgi:hypothetical protein